MRRFHDVARAEHWVRAPESLPLHLYWDNVAFLRAVGLAPSEG